MGYLTLLPLSKAKADADALRSVQSDPKSAAVALLVVLPGADASKLADRLADIVAGISISEVQQYGGKASEL